MAPVLVIPGSPFPNSPARFAKQCLATGDRLASAFVSFGVGITRVGAYFGPAQVRSSHGAQRTGFVRAMAQYRSGNVQPGGFFHRNRSLGF
jgi:hypothetical protein